MLGGALVLGGLAANVMIKERRKARKVPAVAGKSDVNPNIPDVETGKTSKDSGGGGIGIGGGGGGGGSGGGGGGGDGSHSASKNHHHRRDSRGHSESFSDASPHGTVAGGGGGCIAAGGGASDRVLSAAIKDNINRSYHQEQRQEQKHQNGFAGNGHVQDGLLQSWRPRLGKRFSPWRAAAEGPPAGDNNSGSKAMFGERGDGRAMEPLLVSNGRSSVSSGQ